MGENMLQPAGAETSLCVREALFLLAHDEDRGFRRRLHPVTLNFAMSAGVLADLALADSIVVAGPGLLQPVKAPLAADVVTTTCYTTLDDATRGGPKGLREVLYLLASDVTARTQALLTAANVLAVHTDWLGRHRYTLMRPDYSLSARLPARSAVMGDPTALGVTLCALVRVLGLYDALLLLDRAQLEPVLRRITQQLRDAGEPLNVIPTIADTLRAVIEERVVGVMG